MNALEEKQENQVNETAMKINDEGYVVSTVR
jgi:hypothetical protein